MKKKFFEMILLCALWSAAAGVQARAEVIEDDSVLNQARILIDAGQPESARDILKGYISTGGAQKEYAEYLLALSVFSDTDAEIPRIAVEDFRRRYPDSKYAPMALFRLGQFYRVTTRDPIRAVQTYSQFLVSHAQDPLARDAYLWLASSLIDAGQFDRAINTIHQALAIYSYTPPDRTVLEGLLDFARQSTSRPAVSASGGVTIDVQPSSATTGAAEGRPASAPSEQVHDVRSPSVPFLPAASAPPEVSQAASNTSPPPASASSAPQSGDGEPQIFMNFRDAELDDVLNTLSQELDLTFIKDEEVQGKITVINPKKLSRWEAVYLLESILELKGFAMVRSGSVYKILPAAKSVTKGLEMYPDDRPVVPEDRPITKVVRLQHALAQDVAPVLQPLVGDAGSVQADAGKNSVVLTGMASNVQRLESIARAIDESGEADQRETFRLKFLSAAEALPLVQKFLATTQPENLGGLKLVAGPTPIFLFAVGPREMIAKVRDIVNLIDVSGYREESLKVYSLQYANAEKLAGFLETLLTKGLAASAVEGVPTRPGVVSADRITNSIVVLGSRAFHDIVAPLIEKLDYEGFSAFRVQVIPLQYASAADLASKFENIVARGLGPRGEAYSNQILIQADGRLNALIMASVSQSILKTLGSLASALDRPSEEGGTRTVVYYLENADASKLVTVLSDIFSKPDASGQTATKIVADKGTNSLVIQSTRESYDAVMETVMKLDIAPYQVLVEAVILEVGLDASQNLGVDYTLRNSNVDFDIRTKGTSLENLAFTGIKQAVVKNNIQLDGIIQSLLSKTNTRVLATPRIFAANNQEASILIGDQVPVKTGTSTTSGGVTQNTFEYKDVGIKLKVTPHINQKRQTSLDITQEIKTIRASSVSSENPTFQTREAKTNAILGDGQTVIIGGLIRTDRTRKQSKVPIFGDIPVIGAAFRSTSDVDQRTELMIFITPSVVENEKDMTTAIDAQKKAAAKAGFGGMNLDPDTAYKSKFIQDFILK